LFYFRHLKKLVRPETFGPYYVDKLVYRYVYVTFACAAESASNVTYSYTVYNTTKLPKDIQGQVNNHDKKDLPCNNCYVQSEIKFAMHVFVPFNDTSIKNR